MEWQAGFLNAKPKKAAATAKPTAAKVTTTKENLATASTEKVTPDSTESSTVPDVDKLNLGTSKPSGENSNQSSTNGVSREGSSKRAADESATGASEKSLKSAAAASEKNETEDAEVGKDENEDVVDDSESEEESEQEPEIDWAARATEFKEKGNGLYKEKKYTQALAWYEKAVETAQVAELTELEMTFRLNRSAANLMAGRGEAGVADAEWILSKDPTHYKARMRLAMCYLNCEKLDEATKCLVAGKEAGCTGDLTKTQTTVAEARRQIMICDDAIAHNNGRMALTSLKKAQDLGLGETNQVHLRMAKACNILKQFQDAQRHVSKLLRKDPSCVDGYLVLSEGILGNIENGLDKKDYDKKLADAAKILRQALEKDPDAVKIQKAFKKLKKFRKEFEEFRQAYDTREFEVARGYLNEWVATKPIPGEIFLAHCHCELARVCQRLNQHEQAIKECNICLYHKNGYMQAILIKVAVLQSQEKYEESIKILEAAVREDRENSFLEKKLQDAKFELKKRNRPDYYKLLGITSTATEKEIKTGYRKKAVYWHPDKWAACDKEQQKEAEAMFKKINEANEFLNDSTRRSLYDEGYDIDEVEERVQMRKQGFGGGGGNPFGGGGGMGGFPGGFSFGGGGGGNPFGGMGGGGGGYARRGGGGCGSGGGGCGPSGCR